MHSSRTVYRGYAIFISGAVAWTFRAEPISPDLPILRNPESASYTSRGEALRAAKREIDRLLAGTPD